MDQINSYSDFLPMRQSSALTDVTSLGEINSYSEFVPVRQSSALTDVTLPINGTDVFSNISVVWPAGYHAREKEIRKSADNLLSNNDEQDDEKVYATTSRNNNLGATLANTLSSTLPSSRSSIMTNDSDETLWTTALDTSFQKRKVSSTCDTNELNFDERLERAKFEECMAEKSLNETLPIDSDMSFNDTL